MSLKSINVQTFVDDIDSFMAHTIKILHKINLKKIQGKNKI
jgi:hypothetical protein